MNTRDICDVCGGIGDQCVCLCEPKKTECDHHPSKLSLLPLELDVRCGCGHEFKVNLEEFSER